MSDRFNIIMKCLNNNENKFSIYGFGNIGKLFINNINKDIIITNIYDSNISGNFNNIKVKKFDIKDSNTILVAAGASSYSEISEYLKNFGLIENRDFFDIKEYIPLYYFKYYKKIIVPEVHIALTTRCTLNCKNCNMFIPSYNKKEDEKLDDIIKNIDDMFQNIDKIFRLTLLGGEPFLFKDIDKVILHIMKLYSNNIGELEIVTNGTIIPNNSILEEMKRYNVKVSISDYTSAVNYTSKMKLFEEKLIEYGIEYQIKKSLKWVDFLFPYSKFNIDAKDVRNHMLNCSPIFKGVNDSKLYYCHIVWSAVKSCLIKENNNDFIDLSKKLNDDEKLNLLKFSLGMIENKYISLCGLCAGCGSDNNNVIDVGIQI